ncbi:hypothetical protein BKA67DRAFT_567035 [Truncatella angustata]|uniref:Uncharacterized protein n=1 Tax=Truncatella angustata TaxID=152316 RepID=A0A9P8ZX06_9PEZI|nr:uncharacterized protein BKA67DRAFT_567035 [Truncatella angustata]KAH6652623.1 hypothetical protein BKA67DRAFT_567035 [Truncatella angustata]
MNQVVNTFAVLHVDDRPRHYIPEPVMPKPKTRGASDTHDDGIKMPTAVIDKTSSRIEAPGSLSQSASDRAFIVDDRAADVFDAIFFSPNISASPGEVDFKEFLHAMTSIGFCAEKLYGSVWQFSPNKDLSLTQAMHVHEPHPSPKIPYWVARDIGRRMNRRWGWTIKTFVRT